MVSARNLQSLQQENYHHKSSCSRVNSSFELDIMALDFPLDTTVYGEIFEGRNFREIVYKIQFSRF